jgi:hypothetical protein
MALTARSVAIRWIFVPTLPSLKSGMRCFSKQPLLRHSLEHLGELRRLVTNDTIELLRRIRNDELRRKLALTSGVCTIATTSRLILCTMSRGTAAWVINPNQES